MPADQRLLTAGADQDDLIRLARCAAYETAFDLRFAFSDGIAGVVPRETFPDLPVAAIAEIDANRSPTGRCVFGLHESPLTANPDSDFDLWQ